MLLLLVESRADKVLSPCEQQIAGEVGIKAMPTFAFYKNGEKVGTVVGADPNKLRDALKHHSEASA